MHGFNFNEHKNDKVGILRSFVKKFKSCGEETKKRIFDSTSNNNLNNSLNPSFGEDHSYAGNHNVGCSPLPNSFNSNGVNRNK